MQRLHWKVRDQPLGKIQRLAGRRRNNAGSTDPSRGFLGLQRGDMLGTAPNARGSHTCPVPARKRRDQLCDEVRWRQWRITLEIDDDVRRLIEEPDRLRTALRPIPTFGRCHQDIGAEIAGRFRNRGMIGDHMHRSNAGHTLRGLPTSLNERLRQPGATAKLNKRLSRITRGIVAGRNKDDGSG